MSLFRSVRGLLVLAGVLGSVFISRAQGTGVPVYTRDATDEEQIRAVVDKLCDAGKLVRETVLTNQFRRANCTLALLAPRQERLTGRQLWSVARAAHLRVGWFYHCAKCGKWHIDLAAGYPLTKDGAVATCFHVVRMPEYSKEGYLIAANEAGQVFPVTEILAANPDTDACILRVSAQDFKPVALNPEVFPGDRCVCFSDPLGERGYFSDGIVCRFLNPRLDNGRIAKFVTRLDVTTDWAPGSSGAAVLDECGNAIGHVTSITSLSDRQSGSRRNGPTLITIHEAVSAKDVLALVHPPAK